MPTVIDCNGNVDHWHIQSTDTPSWDLQGIWKARRI